MPSKICSRRAVQCRDAAADGQGKHSFNDGELFSTVLQQRLTVGAARDMTRKVARSESRQPGPIAAWNPLPETRDVLVATDQACKSVERAPYL